MGLVGIMIIGAIVIFVPILIFVMLDDYFGWGIGGDGYGDYDTSDKKSNSGSYQHEDFWGVPGGKTSYHGDKATHTDFWGIPQAHSERKENGEIIHTDYWGTVIGRSEDKGDRIDHYSEWGVYEGYSQRNADGSYSHHDIFGTEQGRSQKK